VITPVRVITQLLCPGGLLHVVERHVAAHRAPTH
jgi:hypothetical protein